MMVAVVHVPMKWDQAYSIKVLHELKSDITLAAYFAFPLLTVIIIVTTCFRGFCRHGFRVHGNYSVF